jgi:hypothetical protein
LPKLGISTTQRWAWGTSNNDTGAYWSIAEIDEHFYTSFKIYRTYRESIESDLDSIKKMQTSIENLEGWVISLNNSELIKIKTQWYVLNHGLETFKYDVAMYPVSRVVEMIVYNEIDDYIPYLLPEQIEKIKILEEQIKMDFEFINKERDYLLNEFNTLFNQNIVEFAKTHNTNQFFPIVITEIRGKEPDYKRFWKNNFKNSRYSSDAFGATTYE